MRGVTAGIGAVALALALACGGAGKGGGVASDAVGTYATSLATHFEQVSPGVPCPTFKLGREVKIGDFTWRFDKAIVADGETKPQLIQNYDERGAVQGTGGKVLVLLYAVRNDTPVKAGLDTAVQIWTSEGDEAPWAPYNEGLYRKAHGMTELPSSEMPTSKFLDAVGIVAAKPQATEGAAVYLAKIVQKHDPNDLTGETMLDVVVEQAVIDLGKPEQGPPVNPPAPPK